MKFISSKNFFPILKERDEPICGKNEIIIELSYCGICGSDIGNIFHTSSKPTKKIGHEISGKISEIGDGIESFKIGDRVVVNHHCPCKNCHFCNHGNETMCQKFTEEIDPCGLSQKMVVSEWIIRNNGVVKIPDKISTKDAILIEPIACCIRAWKKLITNENDRILIFGCGPIGIIHSLIAEDRGLKRVMIDIDEHRVNFVKNEKMADEFLKSKKDLEEFNSKIDLCIIANPDISCINDSLKVLRRGGKILFFGEPYNESRISLDMSQIYSKEITILTSYSAANEDFQNSIKFFLKYEKKFSKLISHEFKFEDSVSAINLAKSGNRIKVVVSNS